MKIRLSVLVCAALLVMGVTLVTYTELGTFLFNRGSDIFTVRRLTARALLLVTALALVAPLLTVRARSSVPFFTVLSLSLLIWLLCGRVVADTWDARVATGWFCFRTTTISLYEPGDSDDYPKLWRVTALPGWRLELQRSSGRTVQLFVGPALLSASIDFFAERGYRVARPRRARG